MGLIVFPVCTFVMVIGAHEIVNTLRAIVHIGVGFGRRIILVIVLAGSVEGGKGSVDINGWPLLSDRRRTGERRTH